MNFSRRGPSLNCLTKVPTESPRLPNASRLQRTLRTRLTVMPPTSPMDIFPVFSFLQSGRGVGEMGKDKVPEVPRFTRCLRTSCICRPKLKERESPSMPPPTYPPPPTPLLSVGSRLASSRVPIGPFPVAEARRRPKHTEWERKNTGKPTTRHVASARDEV